MLGQDKLIKRIDSLNLDTFPQSLLLLGDKGCGKHSLTNYIEAHLGIELKRLDSKLSDEIIENILGVPYPVVYTIELDNMLPKYQNTLLKLIEEPPIGKYFILISNDSLNILPTVKNRCKIWEFEKYSKDTLSKFIRNNQDNDLILNIAFTPGQILEYQDHPLKDISNLVSNILDRISITSLPNLLTITDRLTFKDERNKFNLGIFLKILKYQLFLRSVKSSNINVYNSMNFELNSFNEKLKLKNIDTQKAFENFLINFWEASKL